MDQIFLVHKNEFQARVAFVLTEFQARLASEYDCINSHLKASILLHKQQHRRMSNGSNSGHPHHGQTGFRSNSGLGGEFNDFSRRTSAASVASNGHLVPLSAATPSLSIRSNLSARGSGKMLQAASINSIVPSSKKSSRANSTLGLYSVDEGSGSKTIEDASLSIVSSVPPPPGVIVSVPELPETSTASTVAFSPVTPVVTVKAETRFKSEAEDDEALGKKGSEVSRDEDEVSEDDYEFFVLDVWEKPHLIRKSSKFRQDSFIMGSELEHNTSFMHPVWMSGFAALYKGHCQILHPSSIVRLIWDVLSIMLIIFDIVMVPLNLFETQDSAFQDISDCIMIVFWTFDIIIGFFTGYYDAYGTLQMEHKQVAMRYLQTYFGFDFTLVILGWLDVAIPSTDDSAAWQVLRWLRFARAFRLFRFSRLLRLAGTFDFLRWRVQSELVMLLFSIVRHILGILVLAHFVACFWYGISKGADGSVSRWMARYYAEHDEPPSLTVRYAYSFLWALAQFTTVGLIENTEVRSAVETIYGVAIMVFTFVVSACFVSMITTSMTSFQLINEHSLVQSNALRKFLLDNHVSSALAARIQRSALQGAKERKQHTPEKNIELLNVLSKPLRMELRYELYQPILIKHHFFKQLEATRTVTFSSVCHSAIEEMFISAKDVVFCSGEIPKHPGMLFLAHGDARYFWGEGNIENLEQETCLCEAYLWTEWIYHGTLCATTSSRLLVISAAMFHKVTRECLQGNDFQPLPTYAREFVETLNKMDAKEINDLVSSKTVRICTTRAFTCDEKLKPSNTIGSIESAVKSGSVQWSVTQSINSSKSQSSPRKVFFEEICEAELPFTVNASKSSSNSKKPLS